MKGLVCMGLLVCGAAHAAGVETCEQMAATNVYGALGCFRALSAKNPQDPSGALGAAHVLLALNRPEQALDEIDRLARVAPDDARVLLARAFTLATLGRRAEAVAALERARAVEPSNAEVHSALASLASTPEDADAAWRRVLALDPAHPMALRGLAGLALADGNTDDAVALADRSVAADPGAASLALQGKARLLAGDTDGAVVSLRRSLAVDPRDPDAWYDLALACLATDRVIEAAEALTRTDELAPGEHVVQLQLGKTYLLLGRFGDAVRRLGHARQTAGDDRLDVEFHLGVALDRMGRAADAERAYRQALAVDPGHVPSLLNLGSLLATSAGRHTEALALYERALRVEPGSPELRFNRGATLIASGDVENGARELRALRASLGKSSTSSLAQDIDRVLTLAGRKP